MAAAGPAARLQRVAVDRLAEPSSCAGWSVYDLINHVNEPDLVHYLLAHHMHLVEELRMCGLYAAARDGVTSSPQQELLARTGRG